MSKSSALGIILCMLLSACEREATGPLVGKMVINDHFLPGYVVTSVDFDSKGTAWIGTFKQGLIRYGNPPTFYHSGNSSLPDSIVIWDVAVDNSDNVWLGTDLGLVKFDGKSFSIFNTSNSPIAEDVVWSIAVDRNNALWFASCRFREGGLMKLDANNWTLYTPENSPLPSHSVRDVIVDSRNNIWLAMSETVSNASIVRISDDNWTIYGNNEIGFSPYYFGNLAVDLNDNLYASLDYTPSSYHDMSRPNIIHYDGRNWKVNNPVNEKGESLGYVGKIQVDHNGILWAAVSDKECALAYFNGDRWMQGDASFPELCISEIAVDRSNRMWLGTGDGVYIVLLSPV